MPLPEGLYDLLRTRGMEAALDRTSADVRALGPDASEYIVEAIARQLAAVLADLGGDDDERARRQLGLIDELLVTLRERLAADAATRDLASADKVDIARGLRGRDLRPPRAQAGVVGLRERHAPRPAR